MYLRPNEYIKNPLYILTKNSSLVKLTIDTGDIDKYHYAQGYTGHVEYSIVKHIVTRGLSGIRDVIHEGIENYEDTHGIWYLNPDKEKKITNSMQEAKAFLDDYAYLIPSDPGKRVWLPFEYQLLNETGHAFGAEDQVEVLRQKILSGPIHPVKKTPYREGFNRTIYPFSIQNGYNEEIARMWLSSEGYIELMPLTDNGKASVVLTVGNRDTVSRRYIKDVLSDLENKSERETDGPLWNDLTIKTEIKSEIAKVGITLRSDEDLAHIVDSFKENLTKSPKESESDRQKRILKETISSAIKEYKEEELDELEME